MKTGSTKETRCAVEDLGLIPYSESLSIQRKTADRLQKGAGKEVLILLEHPHVITIGRNASSSSLLVEESALLEKGVLVLETDRGGDVTYHGPGQLVGYPIIKLEEDRRDIRRYVFDIEEVLIRTLAQFSIEANRNEGHRGVWARGGKIASLGVRISRWVTTHGFSLNVTTDLSYFSLIHPCGMKACEITSMERELGKAPDMSEVKRCIVKSFSQVFEREMTSSGFPGETRTDA